MSILSQLKTVAGDLSDLKVRWALIGALAVSIHTEPRTTRDIDVALALDEVSDIETILEGLEKRGYSQRQLLMNLAPAQRLGFRLMIPTENASSLPIDLLFSSSGIETEIVQSAVVIEVFPNLPLPVANLSHTLAMKIVSENNSDRIRDRDDIRKLLCIATSDQIEFCKEALTLIEERGFNRGKNLKKAFENAFESFRSP